MPKGFRTTVGSDVLRLTRNTTAQPGHGAENVVALDLGGAFARKSGTPRLPVSSGLFSSPEQAM